MKLSLTQSTQQHALSRDQIAEVAEEVVGMSTFSSAINLDLLVARLEEIFTVWTNDPRALNGDDDHVPWLSGRRGDIQWKFWNRYKLYLIQKQKLEPAAVENIEKVVDEILGRFEDPLRAGSWDRRGLVMGNVQSGKTAAYTGLVCKAADAGYKVIIVLAGLHNNLRSQTQIRLDEGFLGYKAAAPGKGGFEPVGVHQFGPGLKADSVTNRNEDGDFRKVIAKHFAIHPGGNPLLFVVKKNVTVLTHLLSWINHSGDATDPETGRKYHSNVPLLVIDDEADQASIDTKLGAYDEDGKPDPDHDPTAINHKIRRLLYSFDKSAYVGFTATPFANVFVYENAFAKDIGEDLFPRSFIINLPAPSTYVGAARIFGIEEDVDAGLETLEALPITRIVSDHAASDKPAEKQGWMPPKLVQKTGHVPLFDGKRKIPPSLRHAIMCFTLSACVRTLREPGTRFNSMLVHVVRFTNVQAIVKEQIEEALKDIGNCLEHGEGNQKPSLRDEFEMLWHKDYVPTSMACGEGYDLPPWHDIDPLLTRVALSIEVRSINGSAMDTLDYEQHRAVGLNVIAVGGDKLSRGLTLEGLTVSYFLRSSRMYDTLMQMGRWFGYRDKYIDICRLFTTHELVRWFQHIAAATEELKREFDYMVSIGATPRQYGLKVRSHPVLLVTSQVKMRSGTKMRLSYSGDISETIVFDLPKADENWRLLRLLVSDLGKASGGGRKGGYVWKEVQPSAILEFLSKYSAADAPRANPELWSQYIRRQNDHGELTDWTVLLASSSLPNATPLSSCLDGLDVGAVERKASDTTSKRHTIGRLVNPGDESCDLNENERKIALERTKFLWSKDTRKNKSENPPDEPSGRGIRYARHKAKGLLLIYPLDVSGISQELRPGVPLVGIAISFPESDTARDIGYVVTHKFAEDNDFGDI